MATSTGNLNIGLSTSRNKPRCNVSDDSLDFCDSIFPTRLSEEQADFFDRMTRDLYSEDALQLRKGTKFEVDGTTLVRLLVWNSWAGDSDDSQTK